jgi:hypothetical protein
LLDGAEAHCIFSVHGLEPSRAQVHRFAARVSFDAGKQHLVSPNLNMTEARLRKFLSRLLFLLGLGTLGFAGYAYFTEVRYPLGALTAADIQGLRVEMATLPKGPHLRVTGTIADDTLAVRRVFAARIGNAMWLKIYPVAEETGTAAKIDLRVPLKAGTTELRFGPNKELIWRSPH